MRTFLSFVVSVFLFLPSFSEVKVYDCFCFYNEFELLKVRMEELWDHVDYFVLVESIETQRGDAKPLYFEENKELFSKYLSKIIPIAVRERHPEFSLWERENYQRNCIMRGLTNCNEWDLILISDLDEIPRASRLKEAIYKLAEIDLNILKGDFAALAGVAMRQTLYFHQLNRRPGDPCWGDGMWHGTVLTNYRNLVRVSPQYFRDHRGHFPVITDGGWHFTWMGGRERFRLKARSVVEGNTEVEKWTDEEIDAILSKEPVVPLDETFPAFIRNNLEYFKSIGYVADEPIQVNGN